MEQQFEYRIGAGFTKTINPECWNTTDQQGLFLVVYFSLWLSAVIEVVHGVIAERRANVTQKRQSCPLSIICCWVVTILKPRLTTHNVHGQLYFMTIQPLTQFNSLKSFNKGQSFKDIWCVFGKFVNCVQCQCKQRRHKYKIDIIYSQQCMYNKCKLTTTK